MDDETSSQLTPLPDQRRKRLRRFLLWIVLGLLVVCLAGAALSALSNRNLPDSIDNSDRLSSLDKARLAEALQLKEQLGDQVWPGLAVADVPVLLWNRDYS